MTIGKKALSRSCDDINSRAKRRYILRPHPILYTAINIITSARLLLYTFWFDFFFRSCHPSPSQLDPPRYCRLYKCLWLWYPSLCVYTSPFCPLLLSDPHRVCVSLSMAAKRFSRGIEAAKKSDKVNARVISSQFQVACSHSSRNDWYTHRHTRAHFCTLQSDLSPYRLHNGFCAMCHPLYKCGV